MTAKLWIIASVKIYWFLWKYHFNSFLFVTDIYQIQSKFWTWILIRWVIPLLTALFICFRTALLIPLPWQRCLYVFWQHCLFLSHGIAVYMSSDSTVYSFILLQWQRCLILCLEHCLSVFWQRCSIYLLVLLLVFWQRCFLQLTAVFSQTFLEILTISNYLFIYLWIFIYLH